MPEWLTLSSSRSRVSSAAGPGRVPAATPAILTACSRSPSQGATIFTRDDVVSAAQAARGLAASEARHDIAKTLQEEPTSATAIPSKVTGAFEDGRLSLTVDEGRIDEIEIRGVTGANAERMPAGSASSPATSTTRA